MPETAFTDQSKSWSYTRSKNSLVSGFVSRLNFDSMNFWFRDFEGGRGVFLGGYEGGGVAGRSV